MCQNSICSLSLLVQNLRSWSPRTTIAILSFVTHFLPSICVNIFTKKISLVAACYNEGIFISISIPSAIFWLLFYKSNVMNSIFLDISLLLDLSHTFVSFWSSAQLLNHSPGLHNFPHCSQFKVNSAEGKHKAFPTCPFLFVPVYYF